MARSVHPVERQQRGGGGGRLQDWAEQKRQEIRQALHRVDPTGSGSIDNHSFSTASTSLGFNFTDDEIAAIITRFPSSENPEKIGTDDFVRVMTDKFIEKEAEEELLKAFRIIDQDKNGKVSAADIQRISRELCINFTEREIQDMVEEADRDRDGEVNAEEFMRMMRRTSYA